MTAQTLLADRVKQAMSRMVTSVTVVTTQSSDGPVGLTVSSFTSVTLEPPTVMVCLHTESRGYAAVAGRGHYAVSILGGSSGTIAARFATPGMSQADRFRNVDTRLAVTGAPIIREAAAWFDCRVTKLVGVGTHAIVLGEVVAAGTHRFDEVPLAYHDRQLRPLRTPDRTNR